MASEIIRLWMRDPLDDTAGELPPQATRQEAELRAATIRASLERFMRDTEDAIAQAYTRRDWAALEYASWADYVRGEFGINRLKLPRDERRETVTRFHLMGMSTRAIASALSAGQDTIRKDLAQVHQPGAPETVLGADGKRYPAKAADVIDAEVVPDHCRLCGHACAHETSCGLVDGPEGPQCANGETCAERVAASEPGREVEWPAVATPGGAVVSETPGGATGEAPADETPEVAWKGWRQHLDECLSNALFELHEATGDFLDAGTVAQRATDGQVDDLERLAAQLTEFCHQVQELRAPATHLVWMSTTRKGLDYHRIHRSAVDGHAMTGCDRSMHVGRQLERQQAIDFYHAEPCKRCWPNGDEESKA